MEMEVMELSLKYMMRLKEVHQSIDIYYNDLEPEFVVKLIDYSDEKKTTHFRSAKLKTAINDAIAHLEKLQ